MQFEALNTNVDTTTMDFGGRSFVIEEGDYNLQVQEVGEIKANEVKGHAGCMITFSVIEGPSAGLSFKQWFCVMCNPNSNLGWRKQQFDSFAIRLGQLNGIASITHPNVLTGCAFRAHVHAEPREYQVTDEFGSLVTKQGIENSIQFRGKVNEIIQPAHDKPHAVSAPTQQFQQPIQQQGYTRQQYMQSQQPQYNQAIANQVNSYFGGQQVQDDGNLPF